MWLRKSNEEKLESLEVYIYICIYIYIYGMFEGCMCVAEEKKRKEQKCESVEACVS